MIKDSIKDSIQFDGERNTSDCYNHDKYIAEIKACLPRKIKEHARRVASNSLVSSPFDSDDSGPSQAVEEYMQGCDVKKIVSDDVVICIYKAVLEEESFKKKILKNSKAKKKQVIDDAHYTIRVSNFDEKFDSDFCPKGDKYVADIKACLPSKMKEQAHVVAFETLMMFPIDGDDDFSQAAEEFKQECLVEKIWKVFHRLVALKKI